MQRYKNYTLRTVGNGLSLVAGTLLLAACSDPSFGIMGEITGASDKSIILEKADFSGRWIELDSTRTDKDGSFAISYAAPESPEIYRLKIGDNYIYVPIDSIDVVAVKADYASVATSYTLSGTPGAEKMTMFENELRGNAQRNDSIFKRKVYGEIIKDGKGDIMSYYVLTRKVNGKLLYDPENPADEPYISAVATAYKQFRPNDPHSAMLEKIALQARKTKNAAKGHKNVMQAAETAIIDIELPDNKGNAQKLSSYTSNGRPTLVIFSMLTDKDSPEITRRIAQLYNQYKDRYNFYEVCLDTDITSWHEASKSLPWTLVIDKDGASSRTAMTYNVSSLPTFFIYNANGELTTRANGLDELKRIM
jgi:hypothetical protein